MRKDILLCGSTMFSSEIIVTLKIYINYWFNGGHFGLHPNTRLYPKTFRVGFYVLFYIARPSQIFNICVN